ncbi:MAG: hypothetical protein EOM05_00465 [Clostridia bacterium]|nr:hypothetical protein [Clostridia bacterium]
MYLRFVDDVLPLIGSLIAIVAVLYLSYRFSKFMGAKVNDMGNKGSIKILERVALGQDKGLAVAELCGKYYLLGISNNGVTLLMEMPEYTPPQPQQMMGGKSFNEVLKASLSKRINVKAGGKDDKYS